MSKELHLDVIEDSDKKLEKAKNMKESEKLIKEEGRRVRRSVGWYEPIDVIWKRDRSNETKTEQKWDVNMSDGGGYEANTQFEAEVLSFLAQIDYRLKRIEEKIDNKIHK